VFAYFLYKIVIAAVNLTLLLLEFVDECMRDWVHNMSGDPNYVNLLLLRNRIEHQALGFDSQRCSISHNQEM